MGLCWWTNLTGVWPKVPRDAFRGGGAGNQLLLVIPSLEVIIVRNGEWLDQGNENAESDHVFGPVIEAMVRQVYR
jgi:hypothetical protein